MDPVSYTHLDVYKRQMMENELFDVFGRKNKATGGYMTELPDYGVPFIFANFNGTSGDVDVICLLYTSRGFDTNFFLCI